MKKLHAVFLDAYTLDPGDNDMSVLTRILSLDSYARTEKSEIVQRAKNADILIINKCPVDAETIEALPQLKLIQVAATGYNNVDFAYAASKGIPVCNISGYSTSSVAQHVFALLLSYFNNTSTYTKEVREGSWANCPDFSYWHRPIEELAGKTIGVIGYGEIGKAVCRISRAFGMKVIVSHTRKLDTESGIQFLDQSEVFAKADIISLHAPLNDSTEELINAKNIEIMRKGVIIVNTARGGLIHNPSLRDALKSGRVAAALLDVLDEEPPSEGHFLVGLENCFITPHQAWASLQSRQRLLELLHKNLESFLEGRILNKVN